MANFFFQRMGDVGFFGMICSQCSNTQTHRIREMLMMLPPDVISTSVVINDYLLGGQDVTEGRLADTLKEAEEKLLAILKSASEGVIVTDERGIIEMVNDSILQMTGYREDGAGFSFGVVMDTHEDRGWV